MRAACRRCSRTVWRSASSAVLALALAACGTAAAPPAAASATPSTRDVAFAVVAIASSRYDGGPDVIVGVDDQRTAEIRSLVPTANLPAAGSVLVAVFQGQQRTGGYTISVTRIVRDGDRLVITASFTTPPPGSFVTEALTSPAQVVSIARADLGGAKTAVLLDSAGTEQARADLT